MPKILSCLNRILNHSKILRIHISHFNLMMIKIHSRISKIDKKSKIAMRKKIINRNAYKMTFKASKNKFKVLEFNNHIQILK